MSQYSKFGVQVAGAGGPLQPKQSYRYQVAFYMFGTSGTPTGPLVQNVVSCTKPGVAFNTDVEIHSYNSMVRILGKPKWNEITIKFRDDMANGVLKRVGEQIQKQFNFHEQTSAISGNDYKFRMEIMDMDGTHSAPLAVWNVEGCMIKDFKYASAHDYKESAIVEIELVIVPDNCTLYNGTNENVIRESGELFPELGVSPSAGVASGAFGDVNQ